MANSADIVVPIPLSQETGYDVVVGLGVAFAIGMVAVTKLLKKRLGEDNKTTETFMVANQTIGTGLTASAVISSWTYTALLGAPYLTYKYGIALPIWWANGQSVMICCFAFLAIQAKLKVPNAHTLLELIKIRYGTVAHIVWIILALLNNLLNFIFMLVGASTAVSSSTGIDIGASTFLLPLGVVVYNYFGGLRATFLTDYIHNFIIMIVLALPAEGSVAGNYKGSYLTMTSKESLFFGIIHITINFGIVIMDTGFWQKSFAADVAAAVPGYILGGNAYFAIPWAFGTIVGLGTLVLESTPAFPTYPRAMTPAEVSGGLVLPYASQAVAGKGGAVAILLILFMACTSVSSAQLIAMSSIFSFDVYGTYINKSATDKQIITTSHVGVIASALLVSALATAFHKGGVDLNWTIYMLGIVVCPGTFPTCFALLWKGQTKLAATISPIIGMLCGFTVWFGTAYAYSGEISIASTGQTLPCMFGCLTSSFVPLPIILAISWIWPSTFEWDEFLTIRKVGGTTEQQGLDHSSNFSPEKVKYMKRMSKIAASWSIATFLGQIVLWQLPMYGAKMVFGKSFFVAWVVISLILLWLALIVANFYPLADGGIQQIWMLLTGRSAVKEKEEDQSPSSGNSIFGTVEGTAPKAG